MECMKHQLNNQNIRRSGFTLLELLMVISIISILIGLSFSVMNGITEQAEQEATKATIQKLNRLIEQRTEAFERAFKGSRRDSYVTATVGLLAAIDGRFDYYRLHPEKAPSALVILAKKAAFRFEFPQRMVELLLSPGDDSNGNGLPDSIELRVARPQARTYLIGLDLASSSPTVGYEPSAADLDSVVTARWVGGSVTVNVGGTPTSLTFQGHQGKTESSGLLYYTLIASASFGSSSVDADQFSGFEVADLDNDGLPEFVDAWGEPIRFYRWPTRLIDPTAPNPFTPNFSVVNDNTEVDPDPDGDESDGMREILADERLYAGLLLKGLPPAPKPLPGPGGTFTIQRDPLFVDPDDPVGLLYSMLEDPQYAAMGINIAAEINEGKYHTLDTYHVPLVVSAGPDQLLGLYEPHEIDYDLNANGVVDPGEETTPGLVNGAFDGVLGNLAQYSATFITADGDGSTETPSTSVTDMLFDNVTSRNRRAGGSR